MGYIVSGNGDALSIQKYLQNWGYNPGAIDGYWGPNTEAAVRKFQKDRGLSVDGIVGPQTWSALKTPKPAATTVAKPAPKPATKTATAAKPATTAKPATAVKPAPVVDIKQKISQALGNAIAQNAVVKSPHVFKVPLPGPAIENYYGGDKLGSYVSRLAQVRTSSPAPRSPLGLPSGLPDSRAYKDDWISTKNKFPNLGTQPANVFEDTSTVKNRYNALASHIFNGG